MGNFLMKAYENSSKDKLKQCCGIKQFTSLTGCLASVVAFTIEKNNNKTPKYRKTGKRTNLALTTANASASRSLQSFSQSYS